MDTNRISLPPLDPAQSPDAAGHGDAPDAAGARIPRATYRLQFDRDFGFRDAEALVPYLDALGISDVYASPILKARRGSNHGYDVCDPTQLNPLLGEPGDFDRLASTLRAHGMGLLFDTVPNHMGINDACNAWWTDVLENGPSSKYATFFDIDWHPIKPELQNKVLLPVLEDQYGTVLEDGKLRLAFEGGAFVLYYRELKLPIAPGTYRLILTPWLERIARATAAASDGQDVSAASPLPPIEAGNAAGVSVQTQAVTELQSILTAVNHLPARTETDSQQVSERYREKEVIKRRLEALYLSDGEVTAALEATLIELNGRPGDPHSFDLLDALIDAQVFRLAFWRVAGEEINYRRFFDINDLAAVRVEVPEVFQATHQFVLQGLRDGKISGLRIDHPDGLWDPPAYFRRLQETYAMARADESPTGAFEIARQPGAAGSEPLPSPAAPAIQEAPPAFVLTGSQLPLYVVAEKILSDREPLPQDWAIHGTTGYDFLASANNLFIQASNRIAFDQAYREFTGLQRSLDDLTVAGKLLIMRESLASEINALSRQLERIGERNRHYRDFTLTGITGALREVIASLPVYRTYIDATTGDVPERDHKVVQAAVRRARRRRPSLAGTLFNFIEDTLLLRNIDDFDPVDRPEVANFVMKFQQITGPVMAKGAEDTAYYIYNRLVSLNEVGDSPDQFGISPADFHRENSRRSQRWPHSLLSTSTHDNKRSEDVRARINVLSELPTTWRDAVLCWSRLNQSAKTELENQSAPDSNDEYLFYQTLLGAWPLAAALRPEADQPEDDKGTTLTEAGPSTKARTGDDWDNLLRPSSSAQFADFRSRMIAYMHKATKEAKVHTSWISPDAEYDQALESFIERVLDPKANPEFWAALAPVARKVAYYGQFNSLAQVLLRLMSPGVPDTYQGQELWDFSLVDPDNRRPVDYEQRRRLLAELQARVHETLPDLLPDLVADLLAHRDDGRIKLYVTATALAFRRRQAALFGEGAYVPLPADGDLADHICAFMRELRGRRALILIPRLVVGLTGGNERPPTGSEVWRDTWLPIPGDTAGICYRNVFTNEVLEVGVFGDRPGLPVSRILARFPVALLERLGSDGDIT